jgi:hypothetical protein
MKPERRKEIENWLSNKCPEKWIMNIEGRYVKAIAELYVRELLAEIDRLESALAKSEAERFDLTFNAQSDRKAFEAMLEKVEREPKGDVR